MCHYLTVPVNTRNYVSEGEGVRESEYGACTYTRLQYLNKIFNKQPLTHTDNHVMGGSVCQAHFKNYTI